MFHKPTHLTKTKQEKELVKEREMTGSETTPDAFLENLCHFFLWRYFFILDFDFDFLMCYVPLNEKEGGEDK